MKMKIILMGIGDWGLGIGSKKNEDHNFNCFIFDIVKLNNQSIYKVFSYERK